MERSRFDHLAKSFATSGSRRLLLRGIAGAAAGLVGLRGAEAVVCRTVGELCREDTNCCSGLCARDAFGRRTCQCPASTVACGRWCVDPQTAFLSDPTNCGSCGNRCPYDQCQQPICVDGICGTTAITGTACDDGDPCTENDVCTAEETCVGTPLVCGDCEVCQDGICVTDLCCNVACDDCQVCQDGICVTDPCCSVTCGDCEVCQDGICIPTTDPCCGSSDPCCNVVCTPPLTCVGGECLDSGRTCGDTTCDVCQVCQDGTCVTDLCCNVTCDVCQVCQDGTCVTSNDPCCNVVCTPPLTCVDGNCIDSGRG